jgi:predicted phosphodiesterase
MHLAYGMGGPLALGLALVVILGACGDDSDGRPDDGGSDAAEDDGGMDGGEPADAGVDAGGDGACPGLEDGAVVTRDAARPELPDAGRPKPAPELDCGDPAFPGGTALRRKPYLQSITTESARVAWTSTGGGRGVVRVAPSPEGPWREVEAGAEAFPRDRTDDSEAYTGYFAEVQGLEPGQAYCYEIVEGETTLARGLELQTAWNDPTRPVRLLAFGDSGKLSEEQLALRDVMEPRPYDLMLHLGDIAYEEGTYSQFEERFFEVYGSMLHRIPVYPAPGNHEYKTDGGLPYVHVFDLFENILREEDHERYYSFDYGNVHFVSLDSNRRSLLPHLLDENSEDVSSDDDMLDWLRQDLQASDAPWKIAYFHHTPYSSGHRQNELMREHVLPLLDQYGVDLVLAGHEHHYERTIPIRGGCPATGPRDGITYIVAGGAGDSNLSTPMGGWFTAAYEGQTQTFLELTVHGCVARGRAVGLDGEPVDRFTLVGCDP